MQTQLSSSKKKDEDVNLTLFSNINIHHICSSKESLRKTERKHGKTWIDDMRSAHRHIARISRTIDESHTMLNDKRITKTMKNNDKKNTYYTSQEILYYSVLHVLTYSSDHPT